MVEKYTVVTELTGKSTLVRWLGESYRVNFYSIVNADDILAEVSRSGAYSPKFPVAKEDLAEYAGRSTYSEDVKAVFRGDGVSVSGDCVRFEKAAVNSYCRI